MEAKKRVGGEGGMKWGREGNESDRVREVEKKQE